MLRIDKAIHELYDNLPEITDTLFIPSDSFKRYGTYYAESRLYLVYDYVTKAVYFTKADSPNDAINRVVHLDLVYKTEPKEDENE